MSTRRDRYDRMLRSISTQKTYGGARKPLSGLLGAGDEDGGGGGVALRPVAGAAEQHRPDEEGGRRRPLRGEIPKYTDNNSWPTGFEFIFHCLYFDFYHLINTKAAKTE